MSSKLGMLLSLIFVAMFFLLGVDLLSLQFALSDLDAKSVNISYLINKKATLDESLIEYIETTYNVEFECQSTGTPMYGDVLDYTISQAYKPLIISKEEMVIKIKRYVVIGYYG